MAKHGSCLIPALDYMVENMDRALKPEFIPTDEDIVRIRQRTSGIDVTKFPFGKNEWSLVDVGGQKPEGSKWGKVRV